MDKIRKQLLADLNDKVSAARCRALHASRDHHGKAAAHPQLSVAELQGEGAGKAWSQTLLQLVHRHNARDTQFK